MAAHALNAARCAPCREPIDRPHVARFRQNCGFATDRRYSEVILYDPKAGKPERLARTPAGRFPYRDHIWDGLRFDF